MKPFVLIAAAALLLTGCQSKKEICAKFEGEQITEAEATKKLSLKADSTWDEIHSYCQYYKS